MRVNAFKKVNDHVVVLDSGALMIAFQLQGAAFETADPRDLNDWHIKLNQAWRNLADDRLAIWHHIVRREVEPDKVTGFRSDFARDLNQAYEGRIGGRRRRQHRRRQRYWRRRPSSRFRPYEHGRLEPRPGGKSSKLAE